MTNKSHKYSEYRAKSVCVCAYDYGVYECNNEVDFTMSYDYYYYYLHTCHYVSHILPKAWIMPCTDPSLSVDEINLTL